MHFLADTASYLDKLDPIVAVLVLGNVGQWWAYRVDGAKWREAVSALTTTVTTLAGKIK